MSQISQIDQRKVLLEAIGQCILEMVKREWPQLWPGFIDECEELIGKGVSSTIMLLKNLSFNLVMFLKQNLTLDSEA